jgi:hypothetical protein
MLSVADSSWSQLMQRERLVPIGSRSGTREATTLRKLPTARAGKARDGCEGGVHEQRFAFLREMTSLSS